MGHGRPWPLSTERIVKYIANSAAKNMSSLDNQMMVPTLTKFGLLAGLRGTGAVSVTDVVATIAIITTPRRGSAADPPILVQVPWKMWRLARSAPGCPRVSPRARAAPATSRMLVHEGRRLQSRRRHAGRNEARDRR